MPTEDIRLKDQIIVDLALAAVENDEYLGYCTSCLCEHDGIEPDVDGHECYSCGNHTVMGAETVILNYAF